MTEIESTEFKKMADQHNLLIGLAKDAQARAAECDLVIRLLVAAGHVSEEIVEAARALSCVKDFRTASPERRKIL